MIREESLGDLRKRIKEEKPLIHCITNPISIHDCANIILAAGARPIMAEHPLEVEEITATAGLSAPSRESTTAREVRQSTRRTSALCGGDTENG